MSEEHNGMRTRRCGEKSKRRGVCRHHYFFDANARLNHAREHGPKNQGSDGRCNYPTVSARTHNVSLATQNDSVVAPASAGRGPTSPASRRLRLC